MNDENNVLVVRWVLFTTIGGTIGFILGAMAGEQIGFSLGSSLETSLQNMFSSFPSGYLPSMVAGFIYGAVSGFFPGVVQWLAVLRREYERSGIWVFLNMFGMAIAFALNSGGYAFLYSVVNDSLLVDLIYTCMNGLLTGFVVGILHWIFFNRKHAKAFWWLILNIVGWSMLSFIGFFVLRLPFYWLVEPVFVVINGVGFALFTGLALYLTFPQPIQEAEQIIII